MAATVPPFGSSSPRIASSHGFFSCCSSFDAVVLAQLVAGRLAVAGLESGVEALRDSGHILSPVARSAAGERQGEQACGYGGLRSHGNSSHAPVCLV